VRERAIRYNDKTARGAAVTFEIAVSEMMSGQRTERGIERVHLSQLASIHSGVFQQFPALCSLLLGVTGPAFESSGNRTREGLETNLCATHDVEGDAGNQVQEKYADLEDRHPGVVKHIELLD
jgi:hypothetical protein